MTIAADCQLALPIEKNAVSWAGLPEQTRATVLVLLARLIARGVLSIDTPIDSASGEQASDG